VRVLILNQYFDPDVSASARRLTELAEDLAVRDDVIVVAGRPSYDPSKAQARRQRPSRLHVRRAASTAFHRQRPLGRILNYLTYLASALVAGLTTPKPDVVVAATDPPLVGLVGRWIAVLRRVPFVYLLWDVHPQLARAAGLMPDGMVFSVLDVFSRHVLRTASLVLVPTEQMKQSAIAGGARSDRIEVAPLWEDTSLMTPGPRENAFSRAHGLTGKFVVMYSGNIGLTQQLGVLIDAAERILDLDDVIVVLIGEGAGKRRLEDEVVLRRITNVRFMPYRAADEMPLSFAAADVFAVTLASGLTKYMHPSKVFTIMASGRPVVAAIDTDSDTARLITEGRIGLVSAPGDAAILEKHVRWLRDRPAERQLMGERARALAEQQYARSVGAGRYVELIERARSARHPA
jgi:colanic acid biosynthesis glycosyl transferase WcaI